MTIGQAVPRIEGVAKVTGRAKYAADNNPPGLLHAVIVGSPIAAGRITSIDSSAARRLPGVVRVLTRTDMPRFGKLALPAAMLRPPMQGDEVQYEGEAVAIVLAETMEQSVQEPRHGRWLAKNLSNVSIPVNADIPSDIQIYFVDEFDEHASPIGARGIGELGATGVDAAVANAVFDAVGIRVRELPIVPAMLLER